MKIITYTLRAGEKDASRYYRDAAGLADAVLEEGQQVAEPWIRKLKAFIQQHQPEAARTDEEYMLEMLTLGVLWLRYSDDGIVLNKISKEVLSGLVEMRQKGGTLKPGADFFRGILGTFVLYSEHRPELVAQLQFTVKNLANLMDWLTATGEFVQEVKRFENWLGYLRSIDEAEAADLIAEAVSFAMWFEEKSNAVLGRYTEGVEPFLADVGETRRWREDLIFCSRQRLEYHLNMVGAEIMNRAYRADFIRARSKAVLLPACIRKRLTGACQAREESGTLFCESCDPDCQVNKIKQIGGKKGYEIFIIPHESAAFSEGNVEEGELGIIGVACVTNLLAGGWKAKALGIAAQCVLLDYCGCRNHWDDEGFSTEIDMTQLCKIMDESHAG